ncbi:MraY family glycosyltransferase [Entomobacter blattae]|nr:UDP-phosphate alpha-N-acetylglucosaminephosphotransferase [Entomobacter blattae]
MDVPSHRSSHQAPTPKGGGVGVLVAYLFGVGVITLFPFFPTLANTPIMALCIAMAILGGFSWLDDLYQWPAIAKLAIQVGVSLYLVVKGYHFPFWGESNSFLNSLTLVFSLLWLVFIINAVNFMDGLNGLVSGCMAITCFLAGIGLFNAIPPQPLALLYWAALMGFIPLNYPRAQIFLGDVGSQTGGMLMGVFTFTTAQYPYAPYWSILSIPLMLSPLLYDTFFTLIRRKLAGEKLLLAHRGHLYQLAQRSGINASLVTLIEWGFCLYGFLIAWMGFYTTLYKAILLSGSVLLIQIVWSVYIIKRAKKADFGPW